MKRILVLALIALVFLILVGGCGNTYELRTNDIEHMIIHGERFRLSSLTIRNNLEFPVVIDVYPLTGVEISPLSEVEPGGVFRITAKAFWRSMYYNSYHQVTVTAVVKGMPGGKKFRGASRDWSFSESNYGTTDYAWLVESSGGYEPSLYFR